MTQNESSEQKSKTSDKTGVENDDGTESKPSQQDTPPQDTDDNEEVPVTESIARAYMQRWIGTLQRITPKK